MDLSLLRRCTEEVHMLLHRRLPVGEFGPDLMGACAVGGHALLSVLYREGVRGARLAAGLSEWDSCHCWVEYRGWVLDPTHEQFDSAQPWLVAPAPHPEMAHHEWAIRRTLPDDWPIEQHPCTYWDRLGFGRWRDRRGGRARDHAIARAA